jgi:hypothetical protein
VECSTEADGDSFSEAPHRPQKLEVEGFSALHLTQIRVSALPQCAQKLFAGGLLVPHFVQSMEYNRERGFVILLVASSWEKASQANSKGKRQKQSKKRRRAG